MFYSAVMSVLVLHYIHYVVDPVLLYRYPPSLNPSGKYHTMYRYAKYSSFHIAAIKYQLGISNHISHFKIILKNFHSFRGTLTYNHFHHPFHPLWDRLLSLLSPHSFDSHSFGPFGSSQFSRFFTPRPFSVRALFFLHRGR